MTPPIYWTGILQISEITVKCLDGVTASELSMRVCLSSWFYLLIGDSSPRLAYPLPSINAKAFWLRDKHRGLESHKIVGFDYRFGQIRDSSSGDKHNAIWFTYIGITPVSGLEEARVWNVFGCMAVYITCICRKYSNVLYFVCTKACVCHDCHYELAS